MGEGSSATMELESRTQIFESAFVQPTSLAASSILISPFEAVTALRSSFGISGTARTSTL